MRNELSLLRNMWPVVFLGTALVSGLPEGGHDRVAADGVVAGLPEEEDVMDILREQWESKPLGSQSVQASRQAGGLLPGTGR
ncbi:hypothetical protein BO221_29060 [Archangium sp. Cb G35]|uniref:hypothetical protein n=1 Tax=Archangium sp. Cb G35 TaxID=1920190 RepID=UPI000937A364|nr:hypothetical protein [Archangium sp. Cb G35]OJT20946.1 hypothetical protein BO221_29060 [Archangium sp. Cb G35]